jgi:RimJ/RimL family protein N-acetyltransferase/predicted N-acetyltransferase YhbS
MIETDRLILRSWRPSDLKPFIEMSADTKVMEFFPAPLSAAEAETMVNTIEERTNQNGFGYWATELKSTGEFIGFIGLNIPGYPLPFSPCVEIGWRLASSHCGKGYALEGAKASLKFGFEILGLNEIVAFTTKENLRSRNVMQKLQMTYNPSDDFLHPKLPAEHRLAPHVLYRSKSNRQSITIKSATYQDLENVKAFYKSRSYDHEIVDTDKTFIAVKDREIVGVVRLVEEFGTVVLRGMQVNPAYQRQGVGLRLLRFLDSVLGNRECYCIPYTHLEQFYGTIGFKTIPEPASPKFLQERAQKYRQKSSNVIMKRN